MLEKIIAALQEYNDKGITVIKSDAEHDCREIAEYVLQTLKGLKCSYDVRYHGNCPRCNQDKYIIRDCMTEIDYE